MRRSIFLAVVLVEKGTTLQNLVLEMVNTIQENRFYFWLMAAFVLIGGIYLALTNKIDGILFFSNNRTNFLNEAFILLTKMGEAPMYFLIGILVLAVRVRYALLVGTTGLAVLGTSFSLKMLFAVDRPMAFITKQNLLHEINFIDGVHLHTGATSFPSGHTMSAFAIYGLLVYFFPNKKRYALFFFCLSLLVGLSRMYLVQHFWPDVYVGGIIGAFLALLIFTLQNRFETQGNSWIDQPLYKIGRKRG
jgi:membrane-associated phospholipid phosphatase